MNTKPHSHNTEHAAHPGQPDSSVPFTHHESRITSSGRKPTGKIASLPRAQRDIINRMLDDGATGKAIETEMAKHGVSLNGENISNWFQNGFQQYLQHQDHIAEMRLLRENASDLVQDYNVVQFHQAANQLAVGQIFKALTNQQLIDDPINYVRTLNALSRLSRAALVLKQCEDENIKAAGQTAKSEPIRDLETQRKLMLAAFEGATGVKAAPGPIGPDINEYLPVNPDPNPSTSSLAAPKLPGEGGSQPNESAPPAPSTCPSSPSSPSTPLPARACPAYALEHGRVTRHESLSHPSPTVEHPASAPSQIKNQNRRTSLVSKFKNFEPCPSCFAPVPPLLPSGERISPHCDNCGTSLRRPGALIEYCPHCHHLLPELNSAGHRPTPDCPACLNPLPPPPVHPDLNPPLPDAA
jgi:hypothetical protein